MIRKQNDPYIMLCILRHQISYSHECGIKVTLVADWIQFM